jgi:hypothetical protein
MKIASTQACQRHQNEWQQFLKAHRQQGLPGARRIHRTEGIINNQQNQPNQQRHDDEHNETDSRIKNYFTPKRWYCVETICAPCGVIIAWTKFDRAESPTNVLEFLETVYPNEISRPDYICIDKACMVLRTAIASGKCDMWKKTSRFIVDMYHYVNHRVEDYLCRKWCNPAPLNGSAPNLVIVATDRNGEQYYKRAFNTQACEQLNAWLGGFESIVRRMTPANFDWFMHTMLVYHTRHVLQRQAKKAERNSIDINEDEEDEENNIDDDVLA